MKWKGSKSVLYFYPHPTAMSQPIYSNLPETYVYSDTPVTTFQHAANEGLRSVSPDKFVVLRTPTVEGKHAVGDWQQERSSEEIKTRRGVCGLAPWLFWSIISIAVLVGVAAIVVGVLVSPAGDPPDVLPPAPSSSSISISTESISPKPSPTHANASVTTSTIVGPSVTLLRECPSVDNAIHTFSEDSSTPVQHFREQCNNAFYSTQGYDNQINVYTTSLSSCVDSCGAWNAENRLDIQSGKSKICNAVCWRNTLDTDLPGQCFGYVTRKVHGQANLTG